MSPGLPEYLAATQRIPRGETRSFGELAALAGAPGAARAAGRALAVCPARSEQPWHRVTAHRGGLARDPVRARRQLQLLRREGARPRARESVSAWARRRGAAWIGHLPSRSALPADDPGVERWAPTCVEALSTEHAARRRGFVLPGEVSASAVLRPADRPRRPPEPARPLDERLAAIDWDALRRGRGARGGHRCPRVLAAVERHDLLHTDHAWERRIEMAARGYGIGSYGYFAEPAPPVVAQLRSRLFSELRALAADWCEPRQEFPPQLDAFWSHCREAGQRRSACILLHYGEGGVNHPHRDVYGRVAFPFQALVVLSRRGADFEGGDFLLYEQRHDGDERRLAIPASAGDLVVFASWCRWETQAAGRRRVDLRHGMSPIRRGERRALGIVLNLAE